MGKSRGQVAPVHSTSASNSSYRSCTNTKSKYSKTCISWPPTVPEIVANIRRWPTYTGVSQNNFRPYSYFISYLIYSTVSHLFQWFSTFTVFKSLVTHMNRKKLKPIQINSDIIY